MRIKRGRKKAEENREEKIIMVKPQEGTTMTADLRNPILGEESSSRFCIIKNDDSVPISVVTGPISPCTTCDGSDEDDDDDDDDGDVNETVNAELTTVTTTTTTTTTTATKNDSSCVRLDKQNEHVCKKGPFQTTRSKETLSNGTFPLESTSSEENSTSAEPPLNQTNMSTTTTKTSTSNAPPGLLHSLHHKLQFETRYSGLGAAILLCYCVAHLTIYEFLHVWITEVAEECNSQTLVHAGLMTVGLCILRSTGFLWLFLKGRRYRASKQEMKHGLARGSWDAKFYVWIDERERIKVFLEVMGFYFCYIAMYYFWNQFLASFFDQKEVLFKFLPSVQQKYNVINAEKIANSSDSSSSNDAATAVKVEETCEVPVKSWDLEDYEFIYQNVAKTTYYQYSGYEDSPLMTTSMALLVSGSVATISMFLLSQLGYGFIESW